MASVAHGGVVVDGLFCFWTEWLVVAQNVSYTRIVLQVGIAQNYSVAASSKSMRAHMYVCQCIDQSQQPEHNNNNKSKKLSYQICQSSGIQACRAA
jgi:predicted SprT family Zn-dependent metalloprotease